jgi:pimeloyl-ACP methyl ester carboxylesterase
VFVPTLRLSETRLDPRDVEDIVTATEALSERTARRVTILGISYGGSFGLIAAADPRLHDRLELVAVFGAYFDLRGLIQAASTGVSLVGDRRIPWEGDPRAREVLQNAATELVPPGQRDALTTALTNDDGIADLEPEARAVYELVTNDDPAATFALAGRLGDHATRIIEGSSPASVAGSLQVPVIALHSTDDPVTPYGEAVRLEAEMPEARLVTVSLFQHVDLEGASLPAMFPDLVRTWRFTSWVLRSQS